MRTSRRVDYAPPWEHDSNITHAWVNQRNRIVFASGNDDGGAVSSVSPDVSAQSLGGVGGGLKSYFRDFSSRGVGYAKHAASASSSFTADTLATGQSGTAVPFSFAIAGRLPAAPNYLGATGAQWCLFSFARSTGATPFIAVIGSRGSTSCIFQRRNDGNVSDVGGTLALGTTPFVLIGVYSGTTITTLLNGTVVDNAVAVTAGGACTLDQFTVGGLRNNAAGLYSDLEWTHLVLGINKTWPSGTYLPAQSYLRRRIGV